VQGEKGGAGGWRAVFFGKGWAAWQVEDDRESQVGKKRVIYSKISVDFFQDFLGTVKTSTSLIFPNSHTALADATTHAMAMCIACHPTNRLLATCRNGK
jgi:hypothetical protein